MKAKVRSINLSPSKGTGKTPVPEVQLKPDHGLIGDAHAAPGIRQVSLLAWESVCKQNKHLKALRQEQAQSPEVNKKDNKDGSSSNTNKQVQKDCKFACGAIELKPGDFGENLTTQGIDLVNLKVGTGLRIIPSGNTESRRSINKDIELEVTKIGKECHRYCAIYYKTGDCIMPREGIFCKVIKGGQIKAGDIIEEL